MTTIQINPIQLADECSEIEIVIPYKLNAKDLIVYISYKVNGETKKFEQVYISPEELSQWTTDDDYIQNLILSKLKLTRKVHIDNDQLNESSDMVE